jgi:enoyl-CoA hydratase
MTEEKRITTETRGHVLLIGLDRPKKLNAFDPQMLRELAEAYGELERGTHRCAVLFAHGDHFTAGLDLAKVAPVVMQGKGLFPDDGQIDPFGLHGPARTKPVVCAVHGRCLTLGIELMLASDVTIAADDTRLAQIEVKRGIFPFGGATLRWVQTSGWGNAMRWLLTGDELSADEALRIGLVLEVLPRGAHLEKAIAIAETIAAQAPLGVQATLLSARNRLEKGFEGAAKELVPQILSLMQTEDAREGMMSFVERRTAKFEGK